MNPEEQFVESQTLLNAALVADDSETTDVQESIPFEQMEFAQESINILSDIKNTITVEGICSSDILAVEDIRKRLMLNGINLPKSTSLENYIHLTTPERSALNVEVSVESIAKTIVDVIKRIISWLIDTFTKSINWIRSALKNDKFVQAKIKVFDTAAIKMQGIWSKLNTANTLDGADSLYKELGEQMICDPALDKNLAMIVAFGIENPTKTFERKHTELKDKSKELTNQVSLLLDAIEKVTNEASVDNKLNLHVRTPYVKATEDANLLAAFFNSVDKEDYLKDNVKDTFNWYDNPTKRFSKRKFFDYQFIFDNYVAASSYLTKIKRISKVNDLDDAEIDAINEMVALVKLEIKSLNEAVILLTKLRSYYIKVSALHINFYIRAIDILKEYVLSTKVTDTVMGNFSKADRDLEAIKKTVGL